MNYILSICSSENVHQSSFIINPNRGREKEGRKDFQYNMQNICNVSDYMQFLAARSLWANLFLAR